MGYPGKILRWKHITKYQFWTLTIEMYWKSVFCSVLLSQNFAWIPPIFYIEIISKHIRGLPCKVWGPWLRFFIYRDTTLNNASPVLSVHYVALEPFCLIYGKTEFSVCFYTNTTKVSEAHIVPVCYRINWQLVHY